MKIGSYMLIISLMFSQFVYSGEELSLNYIMQQIEGGKELPSTGKISLVEFQKDHLKHEGKQSLPENPTIYFYNKDKVTEQTITFDNRKGTTRFDKVDLNPIKNESAILSDNSNVKIYQGKLLIIHNPLVKSLMMDIRNQDDFMEGGYTINNYRYGYADKSWLVFPEARKIEMENIVSEKNEVIIRIKSEIIQDDKHKVRIVDICPQYKYRCLRLTEYENDKMTREVEYENYKNYWGYYLPERYSNRRYENGLLSKEIDISIDKVEFDIEVDERVFSVDVSDGTLVAGRILPNMLLDSWYTTKAETLTIDSILNRELDNWYTKPETLTIDSAPNKELDEILDDKIKSGDFVNTEHDDIVFLPSIDNFLSAGFGFVFDCEKNKKYQILSYPDSEKAFAYLNEKKWGDLLWDGNFITTRNAQIIPNDKQDKTMTFLSKTDWIKTYKVLENIPLPYKFTVINKEESHFLLTIFKIDDKGVYISCKKMQTN